MADEESKQFATRFFESLDHRVISIETAAELGELRADLLVEYEQDVFVVEAKSKAEHAEFLEHMKRVRDLGTSVLDRTIDPWNALSSTIEKAARQLQATPAPAHAVRLLWASCLHADWRFVLEAIQRRLFGTVLLSRFVQQSDALPTMLDPQECFYYGPADFPRYRMLDGAILACPKGARLLVNEFGERADQLRRTAFHHRMNEGGLVTDPVALEASGQAMAIRKAVPAKDSGARWQYLADTYRVMTAPMREHTFRSDLVIRAADITLPEDAR